MKLMQKLMKKKNKGFSLVELIVVILIIGVLAVAIAPQVTKWVGTAKDNQKVNEKATIQSAVQVAVADFQGNGGTIGEQITISVAHNAVPDITSPATGYDDLEKLVKQVITDKPAEDRTVTITTAGAVTVN